MTTLGNAVSRSGLLRAPARPRVTSAVPIVVLLAAVSAALLRVRYLGAPLTPDEGGFLAVGRQWGHGGSLYGGYWVDRPPLLIALFRVAALTGGLPALRVLGCVATAVTVLGTGLAVRRVAGTLAAGVASVVAAALLVSPLLGTVAVNGELLAAPFVATGSYLAVAAVAEHERVRQYLLAAGAGAAGAAAVLVKQNMLDVGVFAVVLVLAAWRSGHVSATAARRLVLGAGAGALGAALLVVAGAWAAGSRPGEVLFAMYAFRLRATAVLGSVHVASRIEHLQVLGVRELAGLGVVPLALLAALLWARRRSARSTLAHPVGVATLGLAAYALVSVLLGGSYWTHYLVELAVPTALAAGLAARWWPRAATAAAVPVVLSALLAWTLGQGVHVTDTGQRVGSAIASASLPSDTVVTVLGSADLTEATGLRSPYPYLWSLPARTLDPRLDGLAHVLGGPEAPTWLVVRSTTAQRYLDRHATGAEVAARYRLVLQACGHRIYLRDGVQRAVPLVTGGCTSTLAGPLDPADSRSPR